jgi:probable selenium-dependent hydroxylase accessory protein YqeC
LDWDSLKNVLLLEDRGVISLVGAGGKTTLMFSLAKWMKDCGQTVLTTTTTKIFMPAISQSPTAVVSEAPEVLLPEIKRLLKLYGHVSAGAGYLKEHDKIRGFTSEMMARLWQSGIADWIIVEADGAAGRPLKAPASHEPVIPAVTSHLVAVAGLRAIGLPLDEMHVFRTDRYAATTGLNPGETITTSSVTSALLHPEGIMKGASSDVQRFVFLNKAQREDLHESGEEVAAQLQELGRGKLKRIFIGSAVEEPTRWKCVNTGS